MASQVASQALLNLRCRDARIHHVSLHPDTIAVAEAQRQLGQISVEHATSVTRQPNLPVASVVFAAFAPCLTVDFKLYSCDNL